MNISGPYPTLNATDVSSLPNLVQFVGKVIQPEGTVGFLVLLMFFGISFLASNEPFDKRLLTSLFLCTVISTIMVPMGWVGVMYPGILIVLTFIVWIKTGE